MRCSFFHLVGKLRDEVKADIYVREPGPESGFPIHPSASELAESMLVDPEALKNETYEPGIYDEEGDYYPQYADDPSKLPEYIAPNPLDAGGDTAPESSPAETSPSTDNVDNPTE